jgi:mRNA interferase MazF
MTRHGQVRASTVRTQAKGYPFEPAIPDGLAVEGVVLSDQAKSLDGSARGAERACRVRPATGAEVLRKPFPAPSP